MAISTPSLSEMSVVRVSNTSNPFLIWLDMRQLGYPFDFFLTLLPQERNYKKFTSMNLLGANYLL